MSSLNLSIRPPSHHSSNVIDNFRASSASKNTESESRLDRHRGFRKPVPDIATALSDSGWLATAGYKKVRLYRVDTSARTIKQGRKSIKCEPEWGTIRAIALSNELLAIVTYSHLVVVDYHAGGISDHTLVDVRPINPHDGWTPQSVTVRPTQAHGAANRSYAWIAVGGQGRHGVRVYKYEYSNGWKAQADRITLACSSNASSIRHVGFSPNRPTVSDLVIIFGAAESNRIYCWGLGLDEPRTPEPSWIFNCNVNKDGVPHRGAIKAAQVFLSPSRKPYLFCATNQVPGSQILRSCTALLNERQRDEGLVFENWEELPETAIGRNALYGVVTPSGQFVVTVEQGVIRLLTLQPGSKGGIGCITAPKPLEWRSSLTPTTAEVSAVSVLALEGDGTLEIIAADGRGNVECRSVKIRDTAPPTESPDAQSPFAISPQTWNAQLPSPTGTSYEMSPDTTMRFELPAEKMRIQEMPEKSRTIQELPDSPIASSYAGRDRKINPYYQYNG